MTVATEISTTWKKELLMLLHSFDNTSSPPTADVLKMALIKASPARNYGKETTNYSDLSGSPSDESIDAASPAGYTAGGATVTLEASMPGANSPAGRAWIDFQNITWSAVDLSADGCLLYSSGSGNRAIAAFTFGSTKTASGGDFTLNVPAPGAAGATAVLRFA